MTKNEKEIWKSHPDIVGVEVSTLGKVRTLDRVVSSEKMTRFTEGRVLKQWDNGNGYLHVSLHMNGKKVNKKVHRLVAEIFLPNPDNLPQVNHRDCNRKNNNVENLEWCDNSYNMQYREKHGESQGHPVFAINLATMEVSRFSSQNEASRVLGFSVPSINTVIKGKRKQVGGFWFTEDKSKIDKNKLQKIVVNAQYRGSIYAVSLNTGEILQFESQMEASQVLNVGRSHISDVIKGRLKQTGGYWFAKSDEENGMFKHETMEVE